ncbi:MAG: hypothetical protein JSU02_04105, partial [Bacteroidetes bacterium]|nr:hypothetical protein [Bacteroidota bacterium]
DRNAVHNNALLAHVNIYDPATQDRLAGMAGSFMGNGFSADQAQALSYRLLDLSVWKQYSLNAYNDVFLLVGVLTLVCLPLVFFVKYKRPKAGTKVEMAHE